MSGCNTWDPFPVAYVACVIKKLIPAKYFVHHILQNLIKERHLDIDHENKWSRFLHVPQLLRISYAGLLPCETIISSTLLVTVRQHDI